MTAQLTIQPPTPTFYTMVRSIETNGGLQEELCLIQTKSGNISVFITNITWILKYRTNKTYSLLTTNSQLFYKERNMNYKAMRFTQQEYQITLTP